MNHRFPHSSRWLLAVTLLALLMGRRAVAQTPDSTARRMAVLDSVFQRARSLVLDGNGVAGRAIVDSVLAETAGLPAYADALYWRAALAATASDAERDYRRVIVEYPFSAHSGDALFALAQLEMSRSDRASATEHLERFLLEHPNSAERGRAGLWLGRTLLEQNQVVRACTILLRTRTALTAEAVELRNQIDYYGGRCSGVDTVVAVTRVAAPTAAPAPVTPPSAAPGQAARGAVASPRPTSAPAPSALRDSARRDSVRRDSLRRDTARRDSLRRDTARRDSVRRDSTLRDSVRRDSARRDSVRRDSLRRNTARRDSMRSDSVRHASARSDSIRRDAIRRDSLRRDSARRDSMQRDSVRREALRRESIRRDSVRRDSVRRDSVRRASQRGDSVRRPDAPPTLANARYTVQVAAYDTRVEADRLVARLAARGFPARVVGERTPPFRVRIGYYPSETHAETAARDLKAKGIDAFVTTTDNERSPASRAPNVKAPQ